MVKTFKVETLWSMKRGREKPNYRESSQALPLVIAPERAKGVFAGLMILSFASSFILGHSQLITGTLVNAALFTAAMLLPISFLWPMIFIPSLGVLCRGLVFGPLTLFLVYFLPFIWLANFSLIVVFKKLFPVFGYFPSFLLAGLVKFVLLFSLANLLFKFSVVPRPFLTAMGVNQLTTAYLGGLLVFCFLRKMKNDPI